VQCTTVAHVTDNVLLTSPQVGYLLGKSARTIQRMADRGELKVFAKLSASNGAYLFRPEDLPQSA
jgi:hypothetical protein